MLGEAGQQPCAGLPGGVWRACEIGRASIFAREAVATIDVSLVLALHREGKYLHRTLRSLNEAAKFSRAEGLKLELIAVLDQADDLTKRILLDFDMGAFERFTYVEVDNGSLGPTRNDGCALAAGKYILLNDGDDLSSFNYISACFYETERRGPHAVIVPEWVLLFGSDYCVSQLVSLEDTGPFALLSTHPYNSRIFFHRQLFDILKFTDVRLSAGYACEDWHFNANAVALGYTFNVAPDAILFHRKRAGSLTESTSAISVRQAPPSRLFDPEVYLRTCAAFADSGGGRPITIKGKTRLEEPLFQYLIASANHIEPQIALNKFRWNRDWCAASPADLAIGRVYYETCAKVVGLTFDHIFLFSNVGVGGAERYFNNILKGIAETEPGARILVVLGEPHPSNEWLGRMPHDVVVLDLAEHLPQIGERGVDLLTLKLIQHSASTATVHVRQCDFGRRFVETFGRLLNDHRCLFYYFCEELRPMEGFRLVEPWSFAFLSENLEVFDVVVADNRLVAETDRERLGFGEEKWRFLPTRHDPPLSRAEAVARAQTPSARLLWASRMTWQKRPELIRPIAERLYQRWPEMVLDVYGGGSEDFDPALLRGLPNVDCKGGFSDFAAIAEAGYLALVYTSHFDGIPTVLLEAAGMGMPVIAPDVPAIGEFVTDDVTGVLLTTSLAAEEMADVYVQAIGRLREDPALRAALVGQAYDRVMSVHSQRPYMDALKTVLEPT